MRQSERRARPTAILAVLLCLASPVLARQQESVDLRDVFAETIDVRVVNLEVVVTDAQGNRVPGLGRDDFRVLVDGAERPIDFWSEVRDGETWSPRPAAAETAAEPTDGVEAPEPEAHSTSYLVFIDNFFSIGPRRDEVLRGLIEQSRSRSAVYDVVTNGVPVEISVAPG